jgi:hypothetical protein
VRQIALGAVVVLVAAAAATSSSGVAAGPAAWDPSRGLLIEGATVVTMDDQHSVVPFGRVLVRDGRIVGVWSGRGRRAASRSATQA